MEIISRISKGSRMDQIYIQKNHPGFHAGNYVVIRPLAPEQEFKIISRPVFYHAEHLPQIKIQIINEIFSIIEKNAGDIENIIITGSFLEQGFRFNDIDLLLIAEQKEDNITGLKEILEESLGIKMHIIRLSNEALKQGISSDPLYENMLSKCVSRKRIVFNVKRMINPQILDMHLLKSRSLMGNFDLLTGEEKYYLTKNMIAILLFVENKGISNSRIDEKIKEIFGLEAEKIKENLLDKSKFLKRYRQLYNQAFNLIMHEGKR